MKNIILSICLLISINAFSQVDSSTLRSGKLSLRMNDWEYVSNIIAYNQAFENLYDSIKNKIRPLSNANYPAGTTVITVDSVENNSLASLAFLMKQDYNKSKSTAIDRIIAAIRATNSTWVNAYIDNYETLESTGFTNAKNEGKRRLKRQQ